MTDRVQGCFTLIDKCRNIRFREFLSSYSKLAHSDRTKHPCLQGRDLVDPLWVKVWIERYARFCRFPDENILTC